jgi:hypothetical protein
MQCVLAVLVHVDSLSYVSKHTVLKVAGPGLLRDCDFLNSLVNNVAVYLLLKQDDVVESVVVQIGIVLLVYVVSFDVVSHLFS